MNREEEPCKQCKEGLHRICVSPIPIPTILTYLSRSKKAASETLTCCDHKEFWTRALYQQVIFERQPPLTQGLFTCVLPNSENRVGTLRREVEPLGHLTKPRSVLSLAAVLLTMAAMAIPSGALFLMDTSGSILGGQFILPRLSAILPFVSDFTLVAVWLLSVFGALPIAISVALMKSARWAWKAGAVLGAIEVSWIIVEIIMFFDLGFTPMYPLFGGIGLLTIVASLNPSLRRFLSTAPVKFGP